MTPTTLPSGLDRFLRVNLPLFDEPPDADWVEDVALMHGTTVEVLWSVVRQRMKNAPAVPRPLAWTLPSDESQPAPIAEARPFNVQHPFDRVLSALRARGCRILPKHDGRGRDAKRAMCPAHEDRNPSLVVTADGPNVLLHCFGGCPVGRIVAVLGLKLADLFSSPPQAQVRRRRTPVIRPIPAPKLSKEERLTRKRRLTADRTRRWRERRTIAAVTRQNIRSVICDSVTLGDAPNVLRVTSHVESRSVSTPSEFLTPFLTRDGNAVLEISTPVHGEICCDPENPSLGDGGDDG